MTGTLAALMASIVVLVAGRAAGSPERTPARIDGVLAERIAAGDLDRQALVFVHGKTIASARAAVEEAGLGLVAVLERVGVAVAGGPLEVLDSLRTQPGIIFVEAADRPIEFATDTSHIATRSTDVIEGFEVNRSRNGKGKRHQVQVGPFDGSGVSIAVVDSGIDPGHPAFQTDEGTKVVRNLVTGCVPAQFVHLVTGISAGACPKDHGLGEDPVLDVDGPTDHLGHGTHVAGIAAGVEVRYGGRVFYGAAPGASLVMLKAGDNNLYGASVAFEWILEHHESPCVTPSSDCPPIRVVNNSWATYGDYNSDEAISKLTNALIAEGITVVWGAGNEGGDGSANTTNANGSNPTPGNIMVAAYDDQDTGRRNMGRLFLSSAGRKGVPETYPDLSAPGAPIMSACATASAFGAVVLGAEYCQQAGTSMSAPHVSGIVAQLLEANPDLTPARIEDLLEDTADPFGSKKGWELDPANRAGTLTSFDRGHGLVDAAGAGTLALDLPEYPNPQPPRIRAEPGGLVSPKERAYSFSGTLTSPGGYGFYGCEGVPPLVSGLVRPGEGCHYEFVGVRVPRGGATLRVETATDIPEYVWGTAVYLWGPRGEALGESGGGAIVAPVDQRVITVSVEESGIYTIRIVSYQTVQTTFQGKVTLEAAPH